jgi:hypothetical protein
MQKSVDFRSFGLGAALTLGALGLGCGGVDTEGGDTSNPTPSPTPTATVTPPAAAPEFPANSGQAAKPTIAYPAGPYGINVGSVAPDFEWKGFQNAMVQNNVADLQTIRMSDFYNPHASDPTYAPASPEEDDRLYTSELYGAGTPKPKALAIDIGSVWCGPCNTEAKDVLPPLYIKYQPLGGEFLLQLGDGATGGKAATPKDLYNWTKKYQVNFPATIDPDYKLGELFAANAWPSNVIVNTRTMKIVYAIAGVPNATYWAKFESVINAN